MSDGTGGLVQVSAAKNLLGAEAAVQSRETPAAFASGPLAEITNSAIGEPEGDVVVSTAPADSGSSTGGATMDSYHVNGGEGALPTGSGAAPEIVPVSKSPGGATVGSTSINIISPDSRFSKSASTAVSEADISEIRVMLIPLADILRTLLCFHLENCETVRRYEQQCGVRPCWVSAAITTRSYHAQACHTCG